MNDLQIKISGSLTSKQLSVHLRRFLGVFWTRCTQKQATQKLIRARGGLQNYKQTQMTHAD